MGLDGGTIATRTDLLRGASWRLANHDGGAHRSTRGCQLSDPRAALASVAGVEGALSRQQVAVDGFEACSLSGSRFPSAPTVGAVVACGLGRLYLRDAVIEYISRSGQFAPEAGDVAVKKLRTLVRRCGAEVQRAGIYGVWGSSQGRY